MRWWATGLVLAWSLACGGGGSTPPQPDPVPAPDPDPEPEPEATPDAPEELPAG